MQFEWDPKKAEHNLKKHAVDFIEASSVFYDPLSMTYPDPIHLLEKNGTSLLACLQTIAC